MNYRLHVNGGNINYYKAVRHGLCYFTIHDPTIRDPTMHDSCVNYAFFAKEEIAYIASKS